MNEIVHNIRRLDMIGLFRTTKMKTGKEVIGGYGESSGVQCPYCYSRNYPNTEYPKIGLCTTCGNPYGIPMSYTPRKVKV